jgi:cyclic pyranopterin phosphate synthase
MTDEPGKFTHLDEAGRARMVDVSAKTATRRTARVRAVLTMPETVLDRLLQGDLPKGDAAAVARVAGIMAAKRTPELIPLCHNIALSSAEVDFARTGPDTLEIRTRAVAQDVTGVEMEALTAAAVAALAVYDMCKALDKGIVIGPIELLEKTGGKSGTFTKE